MWIIEQFIKNKYFYISGNIRTRGFIMSIDVIFSLEYFNFLGLAHADKNYNGKIDDDEKSIFDDFMTQFDMDKNSEVNENDVPLYRQSVEYTADEKQANKEIEEFKEKYGSSIPNDKFEYFKNILNKCPSFEKYSKNHDFLLMIENALNYLNNPKMQPDVSMELKSKYVKNITLEDYKNI